MPNSIIYKDKLEMDVKAQKLIRRKEQEELRKQQRL